MIQLIGIIGKTHGVRIAKSPAKNDIIIKEKIEEKLSVCIMSS